MITGYLDGDIVNPDLSGSSIHTITGNQVLGNSLSAPSGGNSADGVLNLAFNKAIDKVIIVFSINEGALINPASTPGFGIHNINFDISVYTVGFAPGEGGDFTSSLYEDLEYGDDTPAPPSPIAKPGYTFITWTPDIADIVTESFTYVATGERINCTVTFLSGEGGDFEDIIYEGLHYGDSVPVPFEIGTKPGFIFIGWSPALEDTVTGDLVYTTLREAIQVEAMETTLPKTGQFKFLIVAGIIFLAGAIISGYTVIKMRNKDKWMKR